MTEQGQATEALSKCEQEVADAYAAVEGDFEAESSGEVSLKGIREPVEVFKLVGAAPT